MTHEPTAPDPRWNVLRGDEVPPDALRGRTVALLGFGNQGRAHALNLRDSGVTVVVGGREGGRGIAEARALGFEATPLAPAAARGDLVIVALPDEAHGDAFGREIGPALRPGATVGFLHGLSIRFGLVRPPAHVGIVLVAPKGPGTTLRERYLRDEGLLSLFSVHQESPASDARALALAWMHGIGSGRAGCIEVTFAQEAETDLFGEQAVLCGGLTGLVLAAFELLVEAGYPPELAYIECCHEVRQVADLMHAGGPSEMRRRISNTAEFGSFVAAPRIAGDAVRRVFRELLAEVRDGSFARRVHADHDAGDAWLSTQRAAAERHPIEAAGRHVRALMPWLAREGESPSPDATRRETP